MKILGRVANFEGLMTRRVPFICQKKHTLLSRMTQILHMAIKKNKYLVILDFFQCPLASLLCLSHTTDTGRSPKGQAMISYHTALYQYKYMEQSNIPP